jgi:hypothetical protein
LLLGLSQIPSLFCICFLVLRCRAGPEATVLWVKRIISKMEAETQPNCLSSAETTVGYLFVPTHDENLDHSCYIVKSTPKQKHRKNKACTHVYNSYS